jgi:putative aldouronate transport system substrate-binding protein
MRWVGLLVLLSLVLAACSGPAVPAGTGAADGAAGADNTGDATAAPAEATASTTPEEVIAGQAWRQLDAYAPLPERQVLTLVKGGQENASLMPEGESIEDNRALRYIEDTLNVDVQFAWIVPSDSYGDKLNLSIASGDIPDAMVVNPIQLQQLTEAGAIEDLTAIVEQYANDDIRANWEQTDGVALAAATIDGKVMGIPNVQPQADAPIMAWVRQDWLDKLGLEGPKTVEDVAALAKAFIEQDPDGNGAADTVGLTGTSQPVMVPSNLHGFDGIFNAYGAFPEIFYRDDSGQIVYGSLQPETKEALATLAKWYQEGLIDPEFATKNTDKSNELVVGGKAGIMMGPWWLSWWPLADSVNSDPNADWQPFMIEDKNGEYTYAMGDYTNSFVVVKKGYPHPEVVLRILNVQNDLSYGLNDAPQFYTNFNEIWTLLFPIPFLIEQPYVVERMGTEYQQAVDGELDPTTFSDAMKLEFDQIQKDIAAPRSESANWATRMARLDAALLLAGGINEVRTDPTAARIFTTDPTWPALKKLEEETFLQIITGAKSLDDFDTFVTDWNNAGGAALLEKMNQ